MPGGMLVNWTVKDYERAAKAYCAALPLDHFMEATPQSTQRAITLASLELVKARRPDLHLFNELLVQYPINAHVGQVVPDNMVVLTEEEPVARGSYNLPFEPAAPFWVLEYVSPNNPRKDYEDNHKKYERELRVPYYMLFYPEEQDLRLYHHTGLVYEQVEPNAKGRLAIPELQVEVAIRDGWVRYWYRGKLLPLPAELQHELDEVKAQLREEKRRADEEKRRADKEKKKREAAEAEVEQLRALVEQLRRKSNGKGPSREKP